MENEGGGMSCGGVEGNRVDVERELERKRGGKIEVKMRRKKPNGENLRREGNRIQD